MPRDYQAVRTQSDAEGDSAEAADAEAGLSVCRKLLFGLAAPPLQMTSNVVGFFFSLFLLEVAKLSPAAVSAITFSGRLWDAVTDPLVGQLVLRTRTACGRTRPWMSVAAPAGSVVFLCMWTYVPAAAAAKFCFYFAAYLLYCTCITCYHVPYTSSTMLISSRPQDKDGATAARIGFELLSAIVGCGLFGFITGSKRIAAACDESSVTASPAMLLEERHAYMVGGAVISALYLCCGVIGVVGIRERVPPHDAPPDSLLSNMRSVLGFRPYLLLMLAFLFMSLAIQIVQVNLALYTTHSMKLGAHTNYAILTVLSVAVLFVPLWHRVAHSYGKKPVFVAGLLVLLPCLVAAILMPVGSVGGLYVTIAVSGLAISVAMLLPWSMLPDVIDAFYLQTGQRKEATFYSLYVFFTKFASGASLAVSQLALAVSGYDSDSCQQPDSVGRALRLLIGPGPFACVLASLLLIRLYPIDAEYRQQLNRRLMRKFSAEDSEAAEKLSSLQPDPPPVANGSAESEAPLMNADTLTDLLQHRQSCP